MRKIKTKAELKALGDQFPQPPPEFEEPQCSILEPVFNCDICSKVFKTEEELTTHEINHMKLTCGLCNKVSLHMAEESSFTTSNIHGF